MKSKEEKEAELRKMLEEERISESRNKDAQDRIRDHEEIKKSSRAYQENGQYYRPEY